MMSAMPLVSVIIPTYNRASLVCRAIDNVLAQTWKHVQLIVVDDGSTDETQQRLRAYGRRIQVVTQSNSGAAAARNRGLQEAQGEIVAFQDSDDLWDLTKLERQVQLLETLGPSVPCCLCNLALGIIDGREHTSFSYADMRPQHEEGLWTNVAEVLATRFVFFNQTAAIRRPVLEKAGGFDQTLDFLEDYDLPLRLAPEGPWAFIREPLVFYGEEGDSRFSHLALKNFEALQRSEILIFERSIETARAAGNEKLARLLTSRLGRLRRRQMAGKLDASGSTLGRVAGKAVSEANHLHWALLRRSAWYPRMQTLSVEAALTRQNLPGADLHP